MTYRGDIRLGETVDIKFTSRRFSTGAPFTLAGSPVISAYVGNGTTQITAGITLSVDFDGVTGLNNVRVVATSGNGFATATNVQLVITTGTVDSVSVVGEVVAEFSIENRSAVMPTTAGRTLTIESDGMGHADVKEWLGTAPLALSSQQVQSIVPVTQKVDVETIKTQAVTAAGAITVLASVGTAATSTAQTGDSFARIGAAGVSLSNIPWNASWDAEVQSEVNDALVANHLDHVFSVESTVNDAGASTTAFNTNLTQVDDFWNDAVLTFTTGALAGLSRIILQYQNANGRITFDEPLPSAPANGVGFVIKASHQHSKSQITSDVWANATRTLTAIDEDTTTLDLDATIRTAVGLATANLDTQLDALPTAAENTAAVFAQVIETGVSFLQAQRAMAAKAAGEISGAGTGTETVYAIGNPATARMVATVDIVGNITVWTLTLG